MREEYNISELNPRKNPYTNRLKKQITININEPELFTAVSFRQDPLPRSHCFGNLIRNKPVIHFQEGILHP